MTTPASQRLPERIEERDVVLRRWLVSDAELMARAVEESADHLRPWMAWMAQEPQTLEQREAMLQRWEEEWARGGDVALAVFVGGEVAGSCGFHRRRGPDVLEIGYWIHPRFTRRGLATRLARLLTDAAFSVPGIERVEIHHDKANLASAGVPRALGFRFAGEAPDAQEAPAEVGIDCTWRIDRDEWSRRLSPLRPLEFFSRPWEGEGEFVPFLLGRCAARRFSFRSECDFIDDREWLVRDTTRFANGEISTRTMHARLVAVDRIETTADDMPGGAELRLEPRGFRFRPYVLKLAIGPVRLRVRCRDRCWLDEDEVLHDDIRISFLRLPIGRVRMDLRASA